MRLLLETVASLAQDLALAGLMAGLMTWLRLRRGAEERVALLPTLPWALAVALGGLAVLLAAGVAGRVLPGASLSRWFALPVGLLGTAGAWLLLDAGRKERSGRLADARFLARTGGMWLASSGALQVVACLALRVLEPQGGALRWTLGAAALLVVSSAAGLLGGLAGKPRPSGTLAVLCWVAARAGLLVAGAWPLPLGAG